MIMVGNSNLKIIINSKNPPKNFETSFVIRLSATVFFREIIKMFDALDENTVFSGRKFIMPQRIGRGFAPKTEKYFSFKIDIVR